MDPRTVAELGRERREYVERATQYHAEHGVWPPDPLLDEIDEARREIMAEHGNDWRKVLEYYVELDRQNPERVVRVPDPNANNQSDA
ncbi:MAG TPA: hypothetical protein VLK84_30665 [Longimicrobium sp.]|nr:hypothetical protein [Longimicrobium sp.]